VNPKVERFEDSCFSGRYITGDITPEYLAKLEAQRHDGDSRAAALTASQLDLDLESVD